MMDVLTRDGVVIEIGSITVETDDQQVYSIDGRRYVGFNYRLYKDVEAPDFVQPGAYTFDGLAFGKYKGYFIHDSSSVESANILQAIGNAITVVDYFADIERNSRLQGITKLPCFLRRLQLSPSNSQQMFAIVESLASDLIKTRQELADIKAKQSDQETMLIECFTDLDASLFGGDQNAELV